MTRLIVIIFFFLLSLLCVCPAPAYYLWYVSIIVSEFSVWFFLAVLLILFWGVNVSNHTAGTVIGAAALVLFLSPVVRAYIVAVDVNEKIESAFGKGAADLKGSGFAKPFSFMRMIKNMENDAIPYTTVTYGTTPDGPLTLDFYHSRIPGKRPCIIVIHGGSWSGGDSRQLPDLNWYLAKQGYNIAAINYRLAPRYRFPAPVEDTRTALHYLREQASALGIDSNHFLLLGRSAGAQIALCAGYTLHEPCLKGVISFYGPSDMSWGYTHPANPLVINTRKIMEDYLGGTLGEAPQQYIASSAAEIATAQAIPTLIIHGQNDPLVTWLNAPRLDKKLRECGIKHIMLLLPWATHGCDYTLNGPSGQLCTYTIERFLKQVAP